MNANDLQYSLVLHPPNYYKVLFGFPWVREERLRRYKLYKIQQYILNPENIPNKKKSSLYRFSLPHLELWIQDAFVRNFDQPAFESLAFAWSRAQQDDIPFLDACNVHFNVGALPIAPITSHATLTEISHIRKNLYLVNHLPELRERHSRDKFRKIFKDNLHTLRLWLDELKTLWRIFLLTRKAAMELLIKYIRTQLYKWHLSPILLQVAYFSLNLFLDIVLDDVHRIRIPPFYFMFLCAHFS